jgi:hypothetical protein
MAWFEKVPEWLGTAILGAVFAAAGYTWKTLVDWRHDRRQKRAHIIAHLQALKLLLEASGQLFRIQKKQVEKLMESLQDKHPAEYRQGLGYDDKMAKCYSVLSEDEKALHGVIRSYTQHSLRPVNQALTRWLEEDKWFKTEGVPIHQHEQLADGLRTLEIHLMLWHAKYEYWIPDTPGHALVYLADEWGQGIGFPSGIESTVAESLGELRRRRS